MSITAQSYEVRREFHANLSQLVKSEYEELFRILKLSDETYSENSNGVFFDVMNISEDSFIKMLNFMNFCMDSRKNQSDRIEQLKSITNDVLYVSP